jgi:hypothetical protein
MVDYFKPERPWDHVPCAVSVDRFAAALPKRESLRTDLDIWKQLVVTYAGGNRLWQGIDVIARVFADIRRLEPEALFLGLTHEEKALRAAFEKEGIPASALRLRSVPYDRIQDFLVCADIGLLIRDHHPLNRYACPTKFAEYLASGLHVLTTNSIIDIASLVTSENVGTVMTGPDDLRRAVEEAQRPDRAARSVDCARRHLDWSVHIPKIKRAYTS